MKPAIDAGCVRQMVSRRNMWLNVMGRLKPGVARASAEAALNVFWKPILQDEAEPDDAARSAAVPATLHQPPYRPARCVERHFAAAHDISPAAGAADGLGGPGPADRLRQCGEPDDRARSRTAEGDRDPPGGWRDARRYRAPDPGRRADSRGRGRCARHTPSSMGAAERYSGFCHSEAHGDAFRPSPIGAFSPSPPRYRSSAGCYSALRRPCRPRAPILPSP